MTNQRRTQLPLAIDVSHRYSAGGDCIAARAGEHPHDGAVQARSASTGSNAIRVLRATPVSLSRNETYRDVHDRPVEERLRGQEPVERRALVQAERPVEADGHQQDGEPDVQRLEAGCR